MNYPESPDDFADIERELWLERQIEEHKKPACPQEIHDTCCEPDLEGRLVTGADFPS